MMRSHTKKVVLLYGLWVLIWILVAAYGELFTSHGEHGIGAHLWLTLTGLPLSFVSWKIHPHGSFLGVVLAGIAGLFQWYAVFEIYARWDEKSAKRNET